MCRKLWLWLPLLAVAGLVLQAGTILADGIEPDDAPSEGVRGGPQSDASDHVMVSGECDVDGTEHLIDVGGRKLHGLVYGAGSPTVVLISGFNAPQAYWNDVVPPVAERATVVTYDRAGYGRSEIGDLPLDGVQSAGDLHGLLERMAVPKPYLVVGHSYGASVARLFTSLFPDDVAGLVLVDGQHESVLDEQRKVLEGDDLAALEDAVVMMDQMAPPNTELAYRLETNEQLTRSAPLPEVPCVVISAGDRSRGMPPIFSEEGRQKLLALGMELQQKLVSLVPGAEHVVAEGIGHNIPVEAPESIVERVLEMMAAIQTEGK